MTDSPTYQAMHLAMTELKERERRIAQLEYALESILEITQEEHFIRSAESKLYEIGTLVRVALRTANNHA